MVKILLCFFFIVFSSCKIPQKSIIKCDKILSAQKITKKYYLQYIHDKKRNNINITTIINEDNIRIIGSKLGIHIFNIYISKHHIIIKSNEIQKYSYQDILRDFGISLSFNVIKLILIGYCDMKNVHMFTTYNVKYIVHDNIAHLLGLNIGKYNIEYHNKDIVVDCNDFHCNIKELSCKIT